MSRGFVSNGLVHDNGDEDQVRSQYFKDRRNLNLRRQRDRVVRALDLRIGGPEFKSRSDRWLELFSVVPSSNPRPHL